MITFTNVTDPRISSLPPPYQSTVLSAIRNLMEISRDGSQDQGFVAFVEPNDTPEMLTPELRRSLTSIESSFREGPCLIGMILWGNSGAGVTIICPDIDDYAPDVVSILRQHLGPEG
jgi:hypothetical protein